MMNNRRDFLKMSAAVSLAFASPGLLFADPGKGGKFGYGDLVADPKGILDLPKGFSYTIVSTMGDPMSDGFLVPGRSDGMAAFEKDGVTILMRNHEAGFHEDGPYGEHFKLFSKMNKEKVYDICTDGRPCTGGVSKVIFDTKKQQVISQSLALTGTYWNCAGGPTPWGSWITCEETNKKKNEVAYKERRFTQDHGFNFEVPATAKAELIDPVPLKAMGRFRHEAICVDPRTGVVYQTEDRGNGLFYRYLPNEKGKMHKGGKLQALVFAEHKGLVTYNHDPKWGTIEPGNKYKTKWVDIENVESPGDDLRKQGKNKGASGFCRGEGLWFGNGELFFAATAGGKKRLGQIWKYIPDKDEGAGAQNERGGTIILHHESSGGPTDMKHCDNITVAPTGDIFACEDHGDASVRLIGLTPAGQPYVFASHKLKCEFAGVCFSPDASTMFVNAQAPGITFAITGPWKR